MRPKKNIIKIFLDIGRYWVTLCYTIFSLNTESTIFLPGPLLFSGFGLWFLGSWSWLLELPWLELPGSCPGFGLLCWLQTWYALHPIIYMYLAEWPAFEIGAEEWTPQHNKVKQRAREQREACIANLQT